MLTEKPSKGQRIAWRIDDKLQFHGTVRSVEGNLCWCDFDDGTVNPFIWQFKDGLNKLAEILIECRHDACLVPIECREARHCCRPLKLGDRLAIVGHDDEE